MSLGRPFSWIISSPVRLQLRRSAGLALTLLLAPNAFSQQAVSHQDAPEPADPPPFGFTLPEGYGPFQAQGPGIWVSKALRFRARFEIFSALTESPDADPELVAAHFRRTRWQPSLRGRLEELVSWTGTWAGYPAAGSRFAFSEAGQRWAGFERILVLRDRLVTGLWIGPNAERGIALKALKSLQIPEAWKPEDRVQSDPGKGLGPAATVLPYPGRLSVVFDAGDRADGSLGVELRLRPLAGESLPSTLAWKLPSATHCKLGPEKPPHPLDPKGRPLTKADSQGVHRLSYLLDFQGDREAAAGLGILAGPARIGAFHPGWLAMPEFPDWQKAAEGFLPAPPAWDLQVRSLAHFTALSWNPALSNELLEDGSRLARFPELAAGQAWPFFALGPYRSHAHPHREVWLRSASRASAPDPALRLLHQLDQTSRELLGYREEPWRVMTFPGSGDLNLPGALVLDEDQSWLAKAPDAPWYGGMHLQAGLAGRIAARAFGLRLRGAGSGAGFLDAALATYWAARLLETVDQKQEAEAMRNYWRQRELDAGPLTQPLSLMDSRDLGGAQRLLSRGALVWQAIENRCGREPLDEILRAFLSQGGFWTTEDLRLALVAKGGKAWDDFFRLHVYGVELPPEFLPPRPPQQ
ncbi:MAG: hypothetical protein DWQ01_11935 [Planctomycetota bacterium]|nr:MAG: hypothetical protein DWQ01_11935 [Planctomycetota bacterium]